MEPTTPTVRRTALHERLEGLGARWAERDGWAVAAEVGDPVAAYAAVRKGAGVADRGARGFTRIEGPDVVRFLQGMLTQDVAAVPVGGSALALQLTPKARIVADVRLLRPAAELIVAETDAAVADALRRVLARYRLAAKVRIEPAEDRWGALALAGPEARAVLGAALGVEVPAGDRPADARAVPVADLTLWAVPSPVGAGVDLVGPREALPAAWDALVAAGAVPFGDDLLELLRIEAGVPRAGRELDERVMPAEAGLVEQAVSFTKGCYVGQEPVARLHYRGHANRGLRRLALDGPVPPGEGTVLLDGREVGRLTSAAAPPGGGPVVGLGLLRREVEAGSRVAVAWDGETRTAVVGPATP